MSAQNFREWWNEHRDSMLDFDWDCVAEAAWNAAKETFTSSNIDNTNSLCLSCKNSDICDSINYVQTKILACKRYRKTL